MTPLFSAVADHLTSPWGSGGRYEFDRKLLLKLIDVQIAAGAKDSSGGGLADAIDAWIATELRRAGISADAVWPRAVRPRVVPQALTAAAARFKLAPSEEKRAIEQETIEKLIGIAGASSSTILGGFFAKDIDIVVAEFDRGLELAVSTKTMVGAFAKNITNRFEEASGDLLNIRRRYPLATYGYAYLVTANVFEQPASWERIKDMLRKLQALTPGDERGSYDATCLIVLDWEPKKPLFLEDKVPPDLSPDLFFERILRSVFSRSPVSEHAEARALWAASDPPEEMEA